MCYICVCVSTICVLDTVAENFYVEYINRFQMKKEPFRTKMFQQCFIYFYFLLCVCVCVVFCRCNGLKGWRDDINTQWDRDWRQENRERQRAIWTNRAQCFHFPNALKKKKNNTHRAFEQNNSNSNIIHTQRHTHRHTSSHRPWVAKNIIKCKNRQNESKAKAFNNVRLDVFLEREWRLNLTKRYFSLHYTF